MRFLYIFPHPDDESFGPALAISKQRRQGHEVFLLTLTRGEATKMRLKLGYTREQMGEVRYREMQDVARTLNLNGMTVLNFPDSGLKELDPRELELAVQREIQRREPDIVVTYPVHGISGFHDHLVTHAVVKRVFVEMRDHGASYLKRLAFFTLAETEEPQEGIHHLSRSTEEEIDCLFQVEEEDVQAFRQALDCYKTYQEVIEQTRVKEIASREVAFEIYQENHTPPLGDLCEKLA